MAPSRTSVLQMLAEGMELKLVIDGHLHFGAACELPDRQIVLGLNGERLLDNQHADTGGLGGLHHFEAHIRRRVDMHEVRFFAFEHLPVIGIADINVPALAERVQVGAIARGDAGQSAAGNVGVGVGVSVSAPTAYADDSAFVGHGCSGLRV